MPLLQVIVRCCLSSKRREAVTEETTSFGGTNSALISGPCFPPAAPLPALHGPEALRHCLTTVLPIVLLCCRRRANRRRLATSFCIEPARSTCQATDGLSRWKSGVIGMRQLVLLNRSSSGLELQPVEVDPKVRLGSPILLDVDAIASVVARPASIAG